MKGTITELFLRMRPADGDAGGGPDLRKKPGPDVLTGAVVLRQARSENGDKEESDDEEEKEDKEEDKEDDKDEEDDGLALRLATEELVKLC